MTDVYPLGDDLNPALSPWRMTSAGRFDWWQALVRVLSSVEALREGRALYVLLATFCGAGLAAASAQASVGREDFNWAVGQGAAALFVAFYGVNAAGLIMMDRAQGRAPREVADAVLDALAAGKSPKTGTQEPGRHTSEPSGGPTTLTAMPALSDSVAAEIGIDTIASHVSVTRRERP